MAPKIIQYIRFCLPSDPYAAQANEELRINRAMKRYFTELRARLRDSEKDCLTRFFYSAESLNVVVNSVLDLAIKISRAKRASQAFGFPVHLLQFLIGNIQGYFSAALLALKRDISQIVVRDAKLTLFGHFRFFFAGVGARATLTAFLNFPMSAFLRVSRSRSSSFLVAGVMVVATPIL